VDPDHRLLGRNAEALVLAGDTGIAEPVRLRAIHLLGVGEFSYREVSDVLLLVVASGQSPTIQKEALRALALRRDPSLVNSLLARGAKLGPLGQTEAIGFLIRRNEMLPAVLGALQERRLAPQSFSSEQINYLRTHAEPAVQQAAIRIFGDWQPSRQAIVDQFKPALRLKGVASRGRQIFAAKCAICHRVNGEGNDLGPSLAAAKTLGQEKFLASILEPNAKVAPGYEAHVATMRDGENVVGILKAETESSVVIDQPGIGRTVLPRGNVIGMQANAWSLMPEGLEQGMQHQDMADLLAYLMSAAQW
jgi:putative heme-binding domain-containing protein